MLCQFDFKQTRRLLAAVAFPLLFLPVFYPGDSIFAAEPAADASAAPAAENSSAPAAPAITVTPAQARQALAILQNEKKRAELVETLNAITLAMEMREEMEPGPAPAKPAEAKAPEAPIELTEGGLVAQLFDSIGKRLDAIGDQVRLTARTLLEISRKIGRAHV